MGSTILPRLADLISSCTFFISILDTCAELVCRFGGCRCLLAGSCGKPASSWVDYKFIFLLGSTFYKSIACWKFVEGGMLQCLLSIPRAKSKTELGVFNFPGVVPINFFDIYVSG